MPTKLIRISRYYMTAAIVYLLVAVSLGIFRVFVPMPNSMLHWGPAILGWISFPIMGAYYQFFPTLQGRDLRFEGLTIPQFILANAGLVGIMLGAWSGSELGMAVGTSTYILATLIFAAIIATNLNPAQLNLTLRFYVASLIYFIVAMVLLFVKVIGMSPAWASRPLLLHILIFGWTTMAIMGAEYSMIPMLQLKELRYPRLANAQFYAINVGFWGLAYSMATQSLPMVALTGALVFGAIAVFIAIVLASLKHGPSRLPHLDISVKYFLVGLAYLMIAVLTGIFVAAFGMPQLVPIHIHFGLIGFVTITIVGAMYHIVPFVVWWEVYAPRLGIRDVPLLKELYSSRNATWHLYGLNVGLLLMVAGFALSLTVLLAMGGIFLLLTALSFAKEMLQVLGHRRELGASASSNNNAFWRAL